MKNIATHCYSKILSWPQLSADHVCVRPHSNECLSAPNLQAASVYYYVDTSIINEY